MARCFISRPKDVTKNVARVPKQFPSLFFVFLSLFDNVAQTSVKTDTRVFLWSPPATILSSLSYLTIFFSRSPWSKSW